MVSVMGEGSHGAVPMLGRESEDEKGDGEFQLVAQFPLPRQGPWRPLVDAATGLRRMVVVQVFMSHRGRKQDRNDKIRLQCSEVSAPGTHSAFLREYTATRTTHQRVRQYEFNPNESDEDEDEDDDDDYLCSEVVRRELKLLSLSAEMTEKLQRHRDQMLDDCALLYWPTPNRFSNTIGSNRLFQLGLSEWSQRMLNWPAFVPKAIEITLNAKGQLDGSVL
jgi:hypothetical protein